MKRTLYLVVLAALLAGVVTTESCQSTKKLTAAKILKFNFEKGKGYEYELNRNLDQEIMGQEIKIDASTYYSMDVVEDDGTIKTIKSTFDRFKMNMSVAGMNLEVDTDKPAQQADADENDGNPLRKLIELMSAIKGKQFTMKVNAEGKVLEVTGFDNMAKSIVDSLGFEGDDAQQMTEQFNQQFNDENIKEQFEGVFYIFPNKAIKIGDSWERKYSTTGVLQGAYDLTYSVTSIEGDEVTLNQNGIISGTDDEIKINGKIAGKLIVDIKTGLVISGDSDMTITTEAAGQKFDVKAKAITKGKAI